MRQTWGAVNKQVKSLNTTIFSEFNPSVIDLLSELEMCGEIVHLNSIKIKKPKRNKTTDEANTYELLCMTCDEIHTISIISYRISITIILVGCSWGAGITPYVSYIRLSI